MQLNPLSIYIHYPFCKSKCPYCDFNSHVQEQINHQRFENAYLRELDYFDPLLKNRVIKTIFFGGGTPSLMPVNLAAKILEKISGIWRIDDNCEITLEANPTSFEAGKFKDFRKAGINRLSIGIQALNDSDLKFLGRTHSAAEAINTIKTAGQIFTNYSFDLIYTRPDQKLSDWENELKEAIKLSPNHLSLYQLTIEKGTAFYSRYQKGEFTLPDSELSAQFYELTEEITNKCGLEAYEISNYAKNGYQSQHNLVYWQGGDYLGVGAGAHSRIYLNNNKSRSAIMMIHKPELWLSEVEEKGAAIQQNEIINQYELLEELMLMGLRLKDGVKNQIFITHFGKSIKEIFDIKQLQMLINYDLITADENHISITAKGRILSNAIIEKILKSNRWS